MTLLLILMLAANLDARIAAETERVDAKLQSIDPASLPEGFAANLKIARDRLAAAREGHSVLQRLYRLRSPFLNAELLPFLAEHRQDAQSMERLQALWNAHRASFDTWSAITAQSSVARALIEQADNRAHRLFPASIAYGKVAGPQAGLYYIAEAGANMAFARFVASLPMDAAQGTNPKRADVDRVLESLQTYAIAEFEKDPTSPKGIPASARLKEARELLDSSRLYGAALMLLEARRDLGLSTVEPISDAGTLAWDSALAGDKRVPATAPQLVTVTLLRWPYT